LDDPFTGGRCRAVPSESERTARVDKFDHPSFSRSDVMNKDQVKGRIEEAKGKVKEAVGKATGNETTKAKGRVEQVVGKTRASYGDAKEQLKKQL
jgi:uncharacterized protein YjbJ (UPF0337 family)